MRIRACGLSDVGRCRRINEDCFAIDGEHRFFLVADGMGGHGNGEIASRIAVRAIEEHIAGGGDRRSRWRGEETGSSQRLREAIRAANEKVLWAVEEDDSLVGMGTTIVAFLLDDGRAAVAHVGDSRAYRLRDGRLSCLTSDHTWVNEQLSAGNISESQARAHPFKSVVTRALGGETEVEVETRELSLAPGDRYLLCSDGLTSMIGDEDIRDRLGAAESIEEVCRRLVEEANERGGRDNITVLALTVEDD